MTPLALYVLSRFILLAHDVANSLLFPYSLFVVLILFPSLHTDVHKNEVTFSQNSTIKVSLFV